MKIKLDVQNATGSDGSVKISVTGRSLNREDRIIDGLSVDHPVVQGSNKIEITCPMGEDPLLWDEFEPNLYRMNIEISDAGGPADTREIVFGMREFGIRGTQFTINGRPLFLGEP